MNNTTLCTLCVLYSDVMLADIINLTTPSPISNITLMCLSFFYIAISVNTAYFQSILNTVLLIELSLELVLVNHASVCFHRNTDVWLLRRQGEIGC